MWRLGLVSFPLYDTIALFSQQRNEKDEKMFNRRRRCSRHDGCHYGGKKWKSGYFIWKKTKSLERSCLLQEKGRCNFTNAGDSEDIFNSVVTNRKFLYSAFNGFSNYDTMGFFDELGLAFKIERGNRVFPESDHSSDVIGALQREMKKLSVEVHLNTEVVQVCHKDGKFTGLRVKDTATGSKCMVQGDALIIATGGNSYQSTGSTGDGYRFARELGHEVTPVLPALVPFIVKEEWERELQGLSLKNCCCDDFKPGHRQKDILGFWGNAFYPFWCKRTDSA